MRRTLPASAVSLCLSLVLTTFWLLATPTPAFAATGKAKCSGGKEITCENEFCHCTDNVGCSSCSSGPNNTMNCTHAFCSKSDEEMLAQ